MITLLELLMIAGVLMFIGRPILIRENDPSALVTTDEEIKEDLLQKKEYAFETLSDLDLDFKTGKISEEDFNALKKRYEHEAINVLKEIDQVGKKNRVSNKDSEVSAKKQKGESSKSAVSRQGHFCTQCGAETGSSDKFCNQCGHKV